MTDPFEVCRRVIADHSKSFDLASRLLPEPRRAEVAALYAWCRVCDDAIDLSPPAKQSESLEMLRAQLRSVYADEPHEDPILHCFQLVVRRHQIPVAYPLDLLEGFAMDASDASYRTIDDLLTYCWRVAGTVGLMMCHIMGVSDERAAPHAAHLGIAMQLTNICRDVVEDWNRRRLYLPAALLGPELPALLDGTTRDTTPPALPEHARTELAEAVRALLNLAEQYYASADEGMTYLEPRSALAVRTARLVYAEIGRRIEANHYDVMAGRAVVPTGRKLQLATRAAGRFLSDRRQWQDQEVQSPTSILTPAQAVRLS